MADRCTPATTGLRAEVDALLSRYATPPEPLPSPREAAVEAVSWGETLEHGRLGPALAEAIISTIEAAGLDFTWKV